MAYMSARKRKNTISEKLDEMMREKMLNTLRNGEHRYTPK